MEKTRVVLIGIAGGTGSGKSTISQNIIKAFGSDQVVLIDQDSYYNDLKHLSPEERAKVNFDHPNALNDDKLIADLRTLIAGQAIEKPIYNFVTHTTLDSSIHVEPKPVVLVEGILIYVEKELRDLFAIKLFVDTDADVRVLRRIQRDLHERGRSLESIERQYLQFVRPMHLEFVEPSKRWADIIIPEGGYNLVAMDMIIAKIKTLI